MEEWLTQFRKLSHQELTTLASLSGSVALLVMVALVAAGNFPGISQSLRTAFLNSDNSAAVVSTASVSWSAPGTYQWKAPDNVTEVQVTVIGGGAGGGTGQGPKPTNGGCDCFTGSGGGAGGAIVSRTVSVVPGQTYTIVVGQGGSGATETI